MKKISKTYRPSYIVDIRDIEHLDDIAITFTLAKHNAGLPLNDEDIMNIVDHVVSNIQPEVCIYNIECCECEVRKPWYKRFWNWLTGKKN